MQENFIDLYVSSCISSGISTPTEICKAAKEEISSLEEEVKKIEAIRERQTNLRSLIRQLGGNEIKRNKKSPIVSISLISEKDLDPFIRDMCVKICNYIEEKNPKKLKPREIMDAVSSLEDNKIVLTAIKWLWDQGIVEREENSISREISQGKNWANKPI